VTATFTTLGTHDIHSSFECLLRMSWRTDHVHDQNASLMKTFDGASGRHSNSTDKQLCAVLDCDFDELI
jgi:hypothetical protein